MRKDAGAEGNAASGADRGQRNDGPGAGKGGAGRGGGNRQPAPEPKSLGGLGEALLGAQKR
jgi:hypothetical protein